MQAIETPDKTYKVLIEEMHEGAVTLDMAGTILYCNSHFAKMLKAKAQELKGSKISGHIDYTSRTAFETLFEKGWQTNTQSEVNMHSKSGNAIPVLMSANTLMIDKFTILSIIVTDLTSQKKNEEDLRRKARELEQKNEQLEKANDELAFQNEEKEKRAYELKLANTELAFQNDEKEKRAAELSIANRDLKFESDEKEKRAEELSIANKELVFQNNEKEKRAAELAVANEELAFQNREKEKRAAELLLANMELAFQNDEKEIRAAELIIANKELAYQNKEKEKRAAELIVANKELAFQNEEKEKRAAELFVANKELRFQNHEKEKRAAELVIANTELAFQNDEKEKRASELVTANKELAFQNDEKEKRAIELSIANQDLTSFTYISSHDLQEPLRKIQNFVTCILMEEEANLSESGKDYFSRLRKTALRMQDLIEDLLTYSRTKSTEHVYIDTDLNVLLSDVISDLEEIMKDKKATIDYATVASVKIIPFQFRQLFVNLIGNSFKFAKDDVPSKIIIRGEIKNGAELGYEKLVPETSYYHISVVDNGIGFDPQYKERIFEVFQRLHNYEEYHGTGIGLSICRRIVENHHGFITATGTLNSGAQFDIYLPVRD